MPTRNAVVADHQAELIERLVVSGQHQNASEALRDGLRLAELRDRANTAWIEKVRGAVAVGQAGIAAGRCTVTETDADLDAFVATLDRP